MKFTFLGLLLLSLFSSLPIAAQVDRGAGVKSKDGQPSSEKRLALVIGNSTYSNTTPLVNPANDAADMAAALKGLGFEVISGTNQSKKQMEGLIRQFGDKLAKQGGVGLFFYAGHGLQVNGNNYLVPVEAEIPAQDEVEYATINLGFLLGKMETAQNDLNIVILDACRNNPFARSWRNFRDVGDGKGLAKITPPTGTIMLYATQPGNVASDGSGRNGLFTESLLKQITKPGVELDMMVKLLARDVSEKSGKKQLPWKEGIVLGDFYFSEGKSVTPIENLNPEKSAIAAVSAETSPKGLFTPITINVPNESESWNKIKDSKNKTDFENFLKIYPTGKYADEAKNAANKLESSTSSPINASQTIEAGTVRKNSIGMELVYILAGEFMMGSSESEIDKILSECTKVSTDCIRAVNASEAPKRKVTIKHNFWIGKYEVTQIQWKSLMNDNPSRFRVCGENCPVEQVSWDDIQIFLKKLNEKNDGFVYSLPSETQWEYAARAGSTTLFTFGDRLNSSQANFNGNSSFASIKGQYLIKTTPVGSYQPNAWGLYDVHGNVWEWCQDNYGDRSGIPTDESPKPITEGSLFRVLRGGSWSSYALSLRSANRDSYMSTNRSGNIGFRVIATLK